MTEKGKKMPDWSLKVGNFSMARWENETTKNVNGKDIQVKYYSYTLEKSYPSKDSTKDKPKWDKDRISVFERELPNLFRVVGQAFFGLGMIAQLLKPKKDEE